MGRKKPKTQTENLKFAYIVCIFHKKKKKLCSIIQHEHFVSTTVQQKYNKVLLTYIQFIYYSLLVNLLFCLLSLYKRFFLILTENSFETIFCLSHCTHLHTKPVWEKKLNQKDKPCYGTCPYNICITYNWLYILNQQ